MFNKKHKEDIEVLKSQIENLKDEKTKTNKVLENFQEIISANKNDYEVTIKKLEDDLSMQKGFNEDLSISNTNEVSVLYRVMLGIIATLEKNNIEMNHNGIYNLLSSVYDLEGNKFVDIAHEVTGVSLTDRHNPNDPLDSWSIDADIYSAEQIVSELISIKLEEDVQNPSKKNCEEIRADIIKKTVNLYLDDIRKSCSLTDMDLKESDNIEIYPINDGVEIENVNKFTFEMK